LFLLWRHVEIALSKVYSPKVTPRIGVVPLRG
jgi:hypothetical protein